MAVQTTINGVTYSIPTNGDNDWYDLTDYLLALPNTIAATISVGSPANGLLLTGSVLTLAAATGSTAGALTSSAQTIGGLKTFSGGIALGSAGITFNDLSVQTTAAVNTSVAVFGSAPNSFGASLAAGALTLQPADASHPGGLSTSAQALAGKKTFNDGIGLGSAGITFNDASTQTTAALSTTLGAFGSSPNTKGLSITGSALSLQPADATNPGALSTGTQSIAGNKTFTGNIAAANLSGTNTGDLTLSVLGGTPNANGGSLSGQVLTLQPADGTHPGLVSIAAQTFGGAKTFSNGIILGASGITFSDATVQTTAAISALAAFGSTPNANGASIATGVLTLQPADLTHPGGVSTASQTFGGIKTFNANTIFSSTIQANSFVNDSASNARIGFYGVNGHSTLLNSAETDGATAVGTVINAINALSTAGALLVSIRNNSVEKASFDKDGKLTAGNFSGTSSGTNTGDLTLGSFGSSPSANGCSLSAQVLTLQPADGTHPGGVTTGTQTFAGAKTFDSILLANGSLTLASTNNNNVISDTADGATTAFIFQTQNPLSSSKLFSLQNSATEKLGIDHSGNVTISAPVISTLPGNASTGTVTLHGVISNQFGAAVGNGADTTEDTLFTYTMPANAFNAAGKGVRVTAWGTGVSTTDVTTVRGYFGSTVAINRVLTASQANFWRVTYEVFQTSTSNSQAYCGVSTVGTGSANASIFNSSGSSSQTTSSTIVIKVTGQRATTSSANSVVCNGMLVEFIN